MVEFKNRLKTVTHRPRTVISTAMNVPTAETTFVRVVQGSSLQSMPGIHSSTDPAIALAQPNYPGQDVGQSDIPIVYPLL